MLGIHKIFKKHIKNIATILWTPGIVGLDFISKKSRTEAWIKATTTRRRSSVSIVNFEHISHLVLVSLLLTLNM